MRERLGVLPESIPDLLALVGDAADGFPGLPGWGAKSAAAVLDRWGHLEAIPADPLEWDAGVRGAAKLNATLREGFELALLFRRIATVETDAPRRHGRRLGVARTVTTTSPRWSAELGDERLVAARREAGRRAGQGYGWGVGSQISVVMAYRLWSRHSPNTCR